MVILNREQRTVALLELTCSLPESAKKNHISKVNTYTQLSIALEESGYKVFLVPFEVLSSVTNLYKTSIQNTLQKFHIRAKNSLFVDCAKIALLCTMSVFYAYHEI